MKLVKSVLLSAALLGAVTPGISEARGGHGGHGGHYGFGGFGWGLGLGALIAAPFIAAAYDRPAYYAPYPYTPYPYAPAPVVYTQPAYAPPPAQAQQAMQPWYFCAAANGYYPYVRQCPGGWQQVSPTPPDL